MMQCHDCDTRPPTSTTPLALQHGAFYCLDGTLGALDGLLSHCNHFRLADPGSAYLSFPLSGVDFVYFSTPAHAVTQACQIKVRTVSDSDKSTRKFVTEPWGTLGNLGEPWGTLGNLGEHWGTLGNLGAHVPPMPMPTHDAPTRVRCRRHSPGSIPLSGSLDLWISGRRRMLTRKCQLSPGSVSSHPEVSALTRKCELSPGSKCELSPRSKCELSPGSKCELSPGSKCELSPGCMPPAREKKVSSSPGGTSVLRA